MTGVAKLVFSFYIVLLNRFSARSSFFPPVSAPITSILPALAKRPITKRFDD